jgi:tetratricopeptide (TPR) repeat protein
MTNVSLRIYNREIESLIEGGRIDEVIAHCLHILKTFPMYVETYRLLGKAYLEARRYTDAADIFQRVLMAVPDDFVAHVGMSIIRDDEGEFDEAIWHMERAFEIQPSNPAIQSELKRLYGRRDGIEPHKVRLTRDALANMYTQGELYTQAIAEIRSVMAEDANRTDLQVMLARAYYRAGQKVEATEMSMTLLKKYPYCLDALRILVEILPGAGRAEDAQVYRQRMEQLDPYSSFVKDSVFQFDQVADSAVNLERLDYQPGEKPEAAQPGWASSLGIRLGTGPLPEAIPARATPAEPAAQPSVSPAYRIAGRFEPPAPAEPEAAQGKAAIPDWLRSAGWQEAAGEAKEGPLEFAYEPPSAEPIARADIPDWLMEMAPEEAAGQLNVPEPELSQPTAEIPAPAVTPFEKMPGEAEKAAGPPPKPMPPFEGVKAGAAYEEIGDTQPKWLKDVMPPAPPPPAAEPESTAPVFSEQEPPEPAIASTEPEPATASSGLPSPEDQDAAMAWLESLAAKQGAKAEELLTRPEDRLETPPEWVRQEMAGKSAEPAEIEPTALPSEPEAEEVPPSALQESVLSRLAPQPPATPFMEEATLNWLDSLTAEGSVKPEAQPEAAPEVGQEQAAGILSDIGEPVEAVPEKQEPVEAMPVSQEGDVTAWLKILDAAEMTGETPPASQGQPAPSAGEELPDWLKGLAQPTSAVEPSKEEELPEWLRTSTEAPASVPAQTAALQEQEPVEGSGEAIPTADENVPIPAILTPTAPEEWLPAEKVEPATPGPVSFAVEPAPEPVQPATKPIALTPEPTPPAVEPAAPAPESVQPAAEPVPPAPQPVLSPVPSQDKDAEILLNAQVALKSGKLNDAMAEFSKLIKKGRLLDEVIHDLREAVYTFPVDIILWQTLGDACNRANLLQDALDAYTKAEELLR